MKDETKPVPSVANVDSTRIGQLGQEMFTTARLAVRDWSGMSDLISRQDTLDAIQKRADEIDSVYSAFWEGLKIAQDIVEKVPSAEPELEEHEWCTDYKEYDQDKHCCHRWTKVIRKTVEEVKSQYALEYPKIIHCEDCKFYTPMNRALKTGICSMTMHHLGDDGFCSDAEKRGE